MWSVSFRVVAAHPEASTAMKQATTRPPHNRAFLTTGLRFLAQFGQGGLTSRTDSVAQALDARQAPAVPCLVGEVSEAEADSLDPLDAGCASCCTAGSPGTLTAQHESEAGHVIWKRSRPGPSADRDRRPRLRSAAGPRTAGCDAQARGGPGGGSSSRVTWKASNTRGALGSVVRSAEAYPRKGSNAATAMLSRHR